MTIDNFKETSFDLGSTSSSTDISGTREFRTSFTGTPIKGWHQEIVLEHFKITYAHMELTKKAPLTFSFAGQTVEMAFVLQGAPTLKIDGPPTELSFLPNSHNILHWDSSNGSVEFGTNSCTFLLVNFSPSFFEQFLPLEKTFDGFRQMILDRQLGPFKNTNFPIGPKIRLLLDDILSCKWEGHYRKIYLNAKVLELLLLQLDQFKLPAIDRPLSLLSQADEAKILLAHEYVVDNYQTPLKLQELAKKFGTNEFMLKKGFKTIFGTTVFGCIHDLKMNRAKTLLLEQKLSIGQISDLVGYKNPQHFSTAFKKNFGISPSQLPRIDKGYK